MVEPFVKPTIPQCPTKWITVTFKVPAKDPNPPAYQMDNDGIERDLLAVINDKMKTIVTQNTDTKTGFIHDSWLDGDVRVSVNVKNRVTDGWVFALLRLLKVV